MRTERYTDGGVHKGDGIGQMIDVLLEILEFISEVPEARVKFLQLVFKNPDQL